MMSVREMVSRINEDLKEFEPKFDRDLSITQLSGRKNWRLFRLNETTTFFPDEVSWRIGEGVEIPAGFITDGPSVPRVFWSVLPVLGSWALAGVLHDWLCCRIELGHPHPLAKDRRACDAMFWEATGALGVAPVARRLLQLGVWVGTKMSVRTTMVDNNEKLRAAVAALEVAP